MVCQNELVVEIFCTWARHEKTVDFHIGYTTETNTFPTSHMGSVVVKGVPNQGVACIVSSRRLFCVFYVSGVCCVLFHSCSISVPVQSIAWKAPNSPKYVSSGTLNRTHSHPLTFPYIHLHTTVQCSG